MTAGMKNLFVTFLISLVLQPCAWASPIEASRKAERLLKQDRESDAMQVYEEALREYPSDALLNFNAAAAYYRRGEFSKARELYQKLLSCGRPRLEQASAYNMGNAYLKEAETAGAGQADLLQNALSYYRQALSLTPDDKDAKYNFELTQKKIEQLKQQGSVNKEQQPQEPQSTQKNQDRQNGKDKEGQQEQQREPGQEQQPEQAPETQARQAEENPQDPRQQQPKPAGAEPMTKDEARMLLQDYGKQQLRLLPDQAQKTGQREVEKDW
ncbi:MAG: tetratricopeptide repeat protein [Candidatus Omnitrophota bacterium]